MQKQPSLILGALVGGLTSLPVMALLYLGEQFAGLAFVPFDLFDWLARVLPGDIITLGIDAIVRLIRTLNLGPTSQSAKLIEQLLALGIFVGIGFVLGAVIAWAIRRIDGPAWQAGAWAGFCFSWSWLASNSILVWVRTLWSPRSGWPWFWLAGGHWLAARSAS